MFVISTSFLKFLICCDLFSHSTYLFSCLVLYSQFDTLTEASPPRKLYKLQVHKTYIHPWTEGTKTRMGYVQEMVGRKEVQTASMKALQWHRSKAGGRGRGAWRRGYKRKVKSWEECLGNDTTDVSHQLEILGCHIFWSFQWWITRELGAWKIDHTQLGITKEPVSPEFLLVPALHSDLVWAPERKGGLAGAVF